MKMNENKEYNNNQNNKNGSNRVERLIISTKFFDERVVEVW